MTDRDDGTRGREPGARPAEPPAIRAPGMRAAFTVRRGGVPAGSAAAVGLAMGLPFLAGALAGRPDLGMLASMGAFAGPYARGVPYRRRAAALAAAVVALALGMAAGTLAAPHAWAVVLTLGAFAGLSAYVVGVVTSRPPGALLIMLVAASATGLPHDPRAWALRSGLVLAGGAFTWLVMMSGFPLHPRRPENTAVAAAFHAVADLADAAGTGRQDEARHDAARALDEAARRVGDRGGTAHVRRLRALVMRLSEMFGALVAAGAHRPPPASVAATLRGLAAAVDDPGAAAGPWPEPDPADRTGTDWTFRALRATVEAARAERPADAPPGSPVRALTTALAGARHSLVLASSARTAVCTAAALAVAYAAGLAQPYWVAIAVCAVLMGQNLAGTWQRALNRSAGTVVGIALAGLLLPLHPHGAAVAVIVGVLQFAVELLVARNYALAVVFITPLTLLLVEAGHPGASPLPFVAARLGNTLLGCAFGVLGGYLLWRRAAGRRLPAALAAALRSEGRLLAAVTAGRPRHEVVRARRAAQSALLDLRDVYGRAVGDHPEVETLWPELIATERLGYLILALPPDASGRAGAGAAACFAGLAAAAAGTGAPPDVPDDLDVPDPRIGTELRVLARLLREPNAVRVRRRRVRRGL
ncbi:FUSC family protein [Actinomadura sp. WAC 06369]|uniref:FUSC family protein n=1 Tax=Actinomadura sp. WAC 06369 TaxID=2203193 RepID=UPI001F2CD4B9|nr:FUSC family protein [Actinomadura sp. WAC 06369]